MTVPTSCLLFGWCFGVVARIGAYFGLHRMASSSTHFIVVGGENGSADYDPGPGVDPVYGPTPIITRYAF